MGEGAVAGRLVAVAGGQEAIRETAHRRPLGLLQRHLDDDTIEEIWI